MIKYKLSFLIKIPKLNICFLNSVNWKLMLIAIEIFSFIGHIKSRYKFKSKSKLIYILDFFFWILRFFIMLSQHSRLCSLIFNLSRKWMAKLKLYMLKKGVECYRGWYGKRTMGNWWIKKLFPFLRLNLKFKFHDETKCGS